MSTQEMLLLGFAAAVLLAWYLSYSAARLDRLHGRVEGTLAVLDAALVRRAEAALELANSGVLDPASALLLADASAQSLSEAVDAPGGREMVESVLTEAIRLSLPDEVVAVVRAEHVDGTDAIDRLSAANDRVQLARRFHNDAVTAVRQVRRKVVVRWFRLAGHADLPRTVEFDDDIPTGLRG